MKIHKIVTVEDMVNCTDAENIDNFLADLKIFLQISHEARTISDLLHKINKEEPTGGLEVDVVFEWVDDGKHGVILHDIRDENKKL